MLFFDHFYEKVQIAGFKIIYYYENTVLIYKINVFSMYKEMEQSNMIAKISSIKELFNNIRDTIFREKINKIRANM